MRDAFADEVTKMAKADPRVVLLSGDIGNRLFDKMRAHSPNQFLNCGVAEQNMMGVAAGMGLSGLRPVVYTITPFTTMRCLEQVKIGVSYHKSPVVIVGTGSGLSYASLGPTHHSLEDFSVLRAIPNLQIFAPWDSKSLRACLQMAMNSEMPSYIRIGKKGEPDLTQNHSVPDIGMGLSLNEGEHICILTVGTVTHEACKAAEKLKAYGISAQVMVTHTVMPTPINLFEKVLDTFDYFITVEEHSSIGGFGESFMSYVSQKGEAKKLRCLGTANTFLPFVGSQGYARQYFQIDESSIFTAAKQFLYDK